MSSLKIDHANRLENSVVVVVFCGWFSGDNYWDCEKWRKTCLYFIYLNYELFLRDTIYCHNIILSIETFGELYEIM